jgi:AcrR family transcriptional regulator
MKAPPEEPADRRVRKTRVALRHALVRLVLQNGWENVSVQDVCDEADIARSTFYAHFADKENLLLSAFDDLHATMRAVDHAEPFAFLVPLFEHARENIDLYRAVAGGNSGAQMVWRFKDVLAGLVAETVPPGRHQSRLVRFVTGGIMESLREWIDGGCRDHAPELALDVSRFAVSAASSR